MLIQGSCLHIWRRLHTLVFYECLCVLTGNACLPFNKVDYSYHFTCCGVLRCAVFLQEQAAVPLANQLTPRLLSQLLWCLGQLAVQPQPQLLRQLLRHSARQLQQQQQCNSQDCAQLLQGLAQLQQQPPLQWMGLFCARVQQVSLETVGKHAVCCYCMRQVAVLGCTNTMYGLLNVRICLTQ